MNVSNPAFSEPANPNPSQAPLQIRVDRSLAHSAVVGNAASAEVYKLTLDGETIELLPLKNWTQLDRFKWTMRGKLPAEPAGLEVALDHVKIAGETVALNDPAGCAKLEQLFNEWLRLERETLELARKKAQAQPWYAPSESPNQQQAQRFHVEIDKRGQVHIHCLKGKETLASIGLTQAGFGSLLQQGLMRKPRELKSGVLHDWVELDGDLFSFEKGRNDSARLEETLNQRYLPAVTGGSGKEVRMFLNPASPTGFDIQFPVKVGGVPQEHRQHWDDRAVELLQDPDHCGLLHKGIIVKLIPPNLVFKQKTPDGGEQYLSPGPEHKLTLTDDDGQERVFDLSHPLNFLRLSTAELSAIFNHPAINQHAPRMPTMSAGAEPGTLPQSPPKPPPAAPPRPNEYASPSTKGGAAAPNPPAPLIRAPAATLRPSLAATVAKPAELPRPLPNLWIKDLLVVPALPHDWVTRLLYSKMAMYFGNSSEGAFGPCACWFISLTEAMDLEDPEFKGILLTEKGSLVYFAQPQMARFCSGAAFVGPRDSALEGVHVKLLATALKSSGRVVFIVNDDYREGFQVPETTLAEALRGLSQYGAGILSVTESLASREPIEILWTIPVEQADPADPEALESTRPGKEE